MTPRNEDFLFAQEAQRRGYIGEAQLEEGFLLQKRMQEELQIDERLAVILVKRGWLAEEQARRVYARIEPHSETDEIQGYRIVEKIGRGAMGTVYKAMHLGLHRPVAIKILRRDLARDATQVERLKEEAKLLASLDHPNIVRALDAGESRGFPFVVMEYVDGETLKERISRQGPLHEIDALRIARGLADALERARRMGVVHRDVKPGNIILTKKDEPKLMDLGLAKGPVDLGLTQHGATVGTPQFISPEQAQDPRKADTRSDIYSLGATLYAMVTGRPPFQGTTLAEVLTKVLYEAPTPPRVLNKKVSPEVGYLIERMMLKDPGLRYRTPADVVHDIDEILAGRSIIPDGFTGNWEAFLLRKRIRKWTKIGVSAVAAILVATAATLYVVDHVRTKKLRARGAEEIEQTILMSAVESSDSEVMVHDKMREARAVYERWADLEPPGLEELGRHVWELDAVSRRYEAFARIDKRIDELQKGLRYDMAVGAVDEFLKTVPSIDDPVGRAARTVRGEVIENSARRYEGLRNEVLRASTPTLGDLLRRQIGYRDALEQGLYVTPRVGKAQEEAKATVLTLELIESELQELAEAFVEEALATDLEALRFATVVREFSRRRRELLEVAEADWRRLEEGDWLRWNIVEPKVAQRLGLIEHDLDESIAKRAQSVMTEAGQLHEKGLTDDAKELLRKLALAADAAGKASVEADAFKLRSRIDREAELRRQNALAGLLAVEEHALEMLRSGEAQAIRERIRRTLAEQEPAWPFREEVAELAKLADAYETLFSAAFDGLVRRLEINEVVLLRDGTTDPRWIVKDSDKASGTVLVSTIRGRPGSRRALTEVRPEMLLAWAKPDDGPLPPLVEAAGRLAALPAQEQDDLRPLVKQLQAVADAFRAAGYQGALAGTIRNRYARVAKEQRDREERARTHFKDAQDLYTKFSDYSSAHWNLKRLTAPLSVLRHTDYYEKEVSEILAWKEQVEKQIANLRLAESFPGAQIGLDGEMTWIQFDFENPIQLEVFKEGIGHATGRIEKYVNDSRPVTPSRSDHRFTLLWGMKALVRDRPMQLPCIFDPAERITVEFTLHTLVSPFFLAVDIDGLQVGVLSADPSSAAYAGRWKFPKGTPRLENEDEPPRVNFYGRGRGVAFHHGRGFRDPRTWAWPKDGRGRFWERWFRSRRLAKDLYAFEPQETYRVKVVRDQGTLILSVNGIEIDRTSSSDLARIGRYSDKNTKIRGTGTGLLQLLTWTPQAIDDLRLTGYVLDRYRAD